MAVAYHMSGMPLGMPGRGISPHQSGSPFGGSRHRRKLTCSFDGCNKQPSYGKVGGNPTQGRWCKTHAPEGTIDVTHERCEEPGCSKIPIFGLPQTKVRRWCKQHKVPEAVDVVNRRCEHLGCVKQPSFGIPGTKYSRWCKNHRPAGAIDVVSKRCIFAGCNKQPGFGMPNNRKRTWCKTHAPSGAVNVVSRRCAERGCETRPSYGLPSSHVRKWCKRHAPPEAVQVMRKRAYHGPKETSQEKVAQGSSVATGKLTPHSSFPSGDLHQSGDLSFMPHGASTHFAYDHNQYRPNTNIKRGRQAISTSDPLVPTHSESMNGESFRDRPITPPASFRPSYSNASYIHLSARTRPESVDAGRSFPVMGYCMDGADVAANVLLDIRRSFKLPSEVERWASEERRNQKYYGTILAPMVDLVKPPSDKNRNEELPPLSVTTEGLNEVLPDRKRLRIDDISIRPPYRE